MSSKNVVRITDNSGALQSIRFDGDIAVPSGQSHDDTVTVQKSGNEYTVTFHCDRHGSSDVARTFNSRSGGKGHAFPGSSHDRTPGKLNFTFKLLLVFKTQRGEGRVSINVGQGHRPGVNDWWLGAPQIDSNRKVLDVPVGEDAAFKLQVPLSGTHDSFTFSAAAIKPHYPIQHVFVLMLENHSFDNIFAMSGIEGIIKATPQDNWNDYQGTRYPVVDGAPVAMPTDPGHEFEDVVEQLAGQGARYPEGGPYPPIDGSGYAANYAKVPHTAAGERGKVMACFDTPRQLPVLQALAEQYLLCDRWYSSMPGPTWPNRFFVHGASANGLDHSPSKLELVDWAALRGFAYPNGSIFDALRSSGIPYRVYQDEHSSFARPHGHIFDGGNITQAAAIRGVSALKVRDVMHLAKDLAGDYEPAYTFIEPNYGNVLLETYRHGSSQHPMDETCGAEGLVKHVYESIRNSSLWPNSLLIITYDEHGGFYDSQPPVTLPSPGDQRPGKPGLSEHGFGFGVSGVRVPTLAISPWLPAAVDSTVYDHASVLATLEALMGLTPLTERDRQAASLVPRLLRAARADCPHTLPAPVPPSAEYLAQAMDSAALAALAARAAEPLPEQGNLPGALAIALKTELELAGDDAVAQAEALQRYRQLSTRGEAHAYLQQVQGQVAALRIERAAHRAGLESDPM
ncbi:alkaline phosphatase family protein [Stenotrophomonas sp.]|uniref:alkaline phosphatase family protein n=1 Tax=Stenotrophomonas sp. TaxID=69392 RepID=UPI0028A771AD|nr:alkaline phosphatase family protein [Stenotrophomonas sp.]